MQNYLLLCFSLNVFLVFSESLAEVSESKVKEAIEELKKTGCIKTATDDQFQEFAKCLHGNNKFASENLHLFAACRKFVDEKFSDKPILEAICKTFSGSDDDYPMLRCILEEKQQDYPQDDVAQGTIDSLKKCPLVK